MPTKSDFQESSKNLYSESFSLTPSALITLFEIDVGELGFSLGKISETEINAETNTVFRFHNNVKLFNSSIFWKGLEYIAAPIQADGFEISAKGTSPTPKLLLTVSDEGIPQLSLLKNRILQLGDLSGAKVTRIRTHAKFLDNINFLDSIPPDGFLPDQNNEFPRDIYFIDRKSLEDKNRMELELASILDIERVKLPGRLVNASNCVAQYRGAMCMYEYNDRRNDIVHGEETESTLPELAPPVATSKDELIFNLLGGRKPVDKGKHSPDLTYNSGEATYVEHNNIKYYFVANQNNVTIPPPNSRYWIKDECGKKHQGCNIRYGAPNGSAVGVELGKLPFVAFPSVNKFQ